MSDTDPHPSITPETAVELVPEEREYFWTDKPDEQLRCFIFERVIEHCVDVEAMQNCYDWIRGIKMPKKVFKLVKPDV